MSAPGRKRVLLAEDEVVCSVIVQRMIEKDGYEVVVVKDGMSALREVEAGDFFAVIADWMLPELDGIEIVRRVTSRPGNKTKAFLTSVIDIPAAREHAAAAGALDFLPKPVSAATLLKALRTELKPVVVKAPEGNHPMTRAAAWSNITALSSGPLTELLGTPVSVELATDVPDDPVALTCGLVDARNGSEVTPWILARESAAISVATAMLGEAPGNAEEAADALAEVLNLLAGVLKTEFGTNDFKFTLVLPKRTTSKEIRALIEGAFASIVTTVAFGDTSFALGFSARSVNAVEMRVEDLREGFVLAEDVCNATGGMLLPACTRLTATAAQRLRETCKGRKVRAHVPLASVA